jgi:acetyl-CoA C-acetyltransferase
MNVVMHQHESDVTSFPVTVRPEKWAFATAGLARSDIGTETASLGWALPLNPSGAFKAKVHPPGATGVTQCVELFQQLRGEAVNQVDGARIAVAHNIGGPTAASTVTILEGPGTNGR